MRTTTALRLPKEHGAWGMLYIPFLLGAFVAGTGAVRQVLLGLSMTFLFIGRESFLAWWRARFHGRDPGSASRLMLLYFVLAVAAGLPLILVYRLWGMVPLGVPAAALLLWNAQQAARREERTVFTEVLGIAGLSLTAPAAHYVGLTRWQPTALWLWALSAAYFASSVFYVKLRVANAHGKDPDALTRIRIQCAAYHAVLAVSLATLVSAGRLHPYLLLAYAPIILRALQHLVRPAPQLVLRRVGRLEILYSVIFLVFAVLGFRH